MTTSQGVIFILTVLMLAGGMLFYVIQTKSKGQHNADCRAIATTIPLVNTATGMGMVAAVSECE